MWDIKARQVLQDALDVLFHLNHVGYKEAVFERMDFFNLLISSEPCGI
ncbi:hypothetical protein A45J_1846 [hot springs metagenome]|uniref:Uncharacterized protein n=1 Tax=hot springs metagenome TaxID=433727 RepID=A0A5J4KWY6_9ZZZZ